MDGPTRDPPPELHNGGGGGGRGGRQLRRLSRQKGSTTHHLRTLFCSYTFGRCLLVHKLKWKRAIK